MRTSWILLLLVVCGEEAARAQGTTVQLPSYSRFTTNTTVSVPDRGSAYLGGVNRARSGRNEFGTPLVPLRNRAFGSDRSASGTSVSVYIHDFAAMEEQLLGQSAGVVAGSGDPRRTIAGNPLRTSADPPPMGMEEIRRQRLADQESRLAEARDFFERGLVAEEAGKTNVARIYYQMAAKRASGSLKDDVLARLDRLRREQATKIARKDGPEAAGR